MTDNVTDNFTCIHEILLFASFGGREAQLLTIYSTLLFNPKRHGGGAAAAHRSGDCLPFLTGSFYGHKNS